MNDIPDGLVDPRTWYSRAEAADQELIEAVAKRLFRAEHPRTDWGALKAHDNTRLHYLETARVVINQVREASK